MADTYLIPEESLRRQAKEDGITHISTGIAVIHDGKILAVRRASDDFLGGSYELPGGGVDSGETLEESVRRELHEETGLEPDRIVGMFPGFEYETPVKPKVRQFNFLVETKTNNVVLSDEHDEFGWFDDQTIGDLPVTGSMKDCFERALAAAKQLT